MARSYRKIPIFGHTTAKSEKRDKRICNRMCRRIANRLIKKEIDPEIIPDRKEIYNIWNMDKDGKSYWKEYKRKDMRK